MKSKTSFFNGSVLKKDITRFLPVWALYTVFMLMNTLLSMHGSSDAENARTLTQSMIGPMASGNLIYAAVCALTLFGDLYVPKMCNALHALPMRREGWFLTHALSGLLFSLIPNLLAALVCIPLLKGYAFLVFVWLGAVMLQFLFFFGLALFSIMCAGSRIGMLSVYGIINFFSLFLYSIVSLLYVPLLYGVEISISPFAHFCPVVQMSSHSYLKSELSKLDGSLLIHSYTASSWSYLGILAAIGLVLGALAILLYRRRHLERAGDLLSVKQLSPLFLVIITLFSGMAFYFFSEVFFSKGNYLLLFAGMVVGFFVARMLMERTVRVFHRKSLMGFLLITALTAGSLFLTHMDPIGIVSRVPAVEDVVSCTFRAGYGRSSEVPIVTEEQIQKVQQFHTALYQSPPSTPGQMYYSASGSDFPVEITYTLKNGTQLSRRYVANTGTELGKELKQFLTHWKIVLNTDDLRILSSQIQSVSFDMWEKDIWGLTVRNADFLPLLTAIKADCDAGNMAQGNAFHTDDEQSTVVLTLKPKDPRHPETYDTISLVVYSSCTNTIKALNALALHAPS